MGLFLSFTGSSNCISGSNFEK